MKSHKGSVRNTLQRLRARAGAAIAMSLRRVATKLDGTDAICVRIECSPPIPLQAKIECMRQGVKAIERAVVETIREEVREAELRRSLPMMFDIKS